MVDNIQSTNDLQKEFNQKIDEVNILFLDISSSCTGYSIGRVNFSTKKVEFTDAGAIWLDPNWSHQEKYSYMYYAISNYFWTAKGIDYVVAEQYSVNPKKMMGINVVSEMQGAIKAAAWDNGVKVTSVLPQTWRKHMQIKKNAQGDYKAPTQAKIATYVTVPQTSISNITGQARQTPNDLYDALAIGMGWLIKIGFVDTNMSFTNIKFNSHIGHQLGK